MNTLIVILLLLSTMAFAQEDMVAQVESKDIQKVDSTTFQTVVTTSQQKDISVESISQQCSGIDSQLSKLDVKEQNLVNQYDHEEAGIVADRASLQWKQQECQSVVSAVNSYLKTNDKSNVNWTALNEYIK